MTPVESADIPGMKATVGDLAVFGDAQTGKLDQANDKIVNGQATIEACEARDAAAIKKATKRGLF
jgi:hypothetical protein